MTVKQGTKPNDSSVDLLWNQAFQELDAWVKRSNFREDVLLQSAKQFSENVKRNQNNIKELYGQFSKELRDWEKTAREELLTTTTGLQYLFPVKSYEEINKQLDDAQDKRTTLVSSPLNHLANGDHADNFVSALEQYINFRRKNRALYVKSVKETASIIQDNQRAFLNIMTNQIKNLFFPINQYIERSSEAPKS
ncbi:hypothetical protein [Bacillus sp. V5-8f]|uniref:hypothetical protein n=1 Tax=Bacillus sp. V5-8f TaxID=2053044 RepID=UPI000C785DA4|nr:hypothetical protein [Bacillus sp. V5-8f]PLT35107.1 hypothetical protein CUU64_06920 [Bacillus sp. V5-8f]